MFSYTKKEFFSLISICIGSFLIILDTNILNVVMPVIKQQLNLTYFQMSWVTNSYIVIFASLLLFMSMVTKNIGNKKAYIYGISIFLLGSIIAGMASDYAYLLAGRIIQGVGAAIFSPVATLLLNQIFIDSKKKATAFGLWSGTSGIAFAFSPIIGGILSDTMGYQSVFFINIPFTIIIIIFGFISLPKNEKHHMRYHFFEQFLFFIFMVIFVIYISFIDQISLIVNIITILLFSLLIFLGIKIILKGKVEIIPNDLFNKSNLSSLTNTFTYNMGCYGFMLALSLFYQSYQNHSSMMTGILFLPFTLSGMLLTSFLSPIISEKLGFYKGQRISLLSMLIGLLIISFSFLIKDTLFLLSLGYLFLGFSGIVAPVATNALYQDTFNKYHNEISSFLNIFRQFGSIIGIILATILVHRFGGVIGIYILSLIIIIIISGVTVISKKVQV